MRNIERTWIDFESKLPELTPETEPKALELLEIAERQRLRAMAATMR
ncbi:MAG: hypothetical protein NC211_07675 [Alistipes senegalensis]|nr:hypothetical protein [Oxalobacter formigenes]MCM1281687.1 hypothetical protein [Alistipes senegalensis]